MMGVNFDEIERLHRQLGCLPDIPRLPDLPRFPDLAGETVPLVESLRPSIERAWIADAAFTRHQHEMLAGIAGTFARFHQESIDALQRTIGSGVAEWAKQAGQIQRLLAPPDTASLLRTFTDDLRKATEAIGELTARAALEVSQAAAETIASTVMSEWTRRLAEPGFASAFAGQLWRVAARAAGEENAVGGFGDVERLLAEKAGTLPPGHISAEAMLQILLALILFWLAAHSDTKRFSAVDDVLRTVQVEVEELHGASRRLLDKIEELRPREAIYPTAVVRRPVNLRTRPTGASAKLGTLAANELVSLVQERAKWTYVEYFDYVEAVPRTGWVLKKCLQKTEPNAKGAGRLKVLQLKRLARVS